MTGGQMTKAQKSLCEEPLLLWAVRESAMQTFVHVGMLKPHENGKACRCRCRSCGESLVAINADKPASHFERPGTQRRHFKHYRMDATPLGCLSAVGRLLALQLFVEQDAILLPPRTRTVTRLAPTGIDVEAVQKIPGELVRVATRVWVDGTTALLCLEDGRELIVTVRARHEVDDDSRSTCVLSLAGVGDPAIAGWSSERILNHLRFPGSGIDWDVHWNDGYLVAKQGEVLSEQEDLLLGGIPREWLVNLKGKQVNETILHWLIKKTVADQRVLYVPGLSVPVRQGMPDGKIAEEMARCPATVLELENVRLEKRFDSMVPDVMCEARRVGTNGPPMQLLIEAAVSNYIDDEKRKKIALSGVACIQIRADLFSKAGIVHVSEIQNIILSDTSVKEWIVHPWIAEEIAQAKKRLAVRARDIHAAKEAKALVERKQNQDQGQLRHWLSTSSDLNLAKGYLKALSAAWADKPTLSWGTAEIFLDDLWQELQRRHIVGADRQKVEGSDGLLSQLVGIKKEAKDRNGSALIRRAGQVADFHWTAKEKGLVLMFAIEVHRPLMTVQQVEALEECCATLRTAVQECDDRVTRSTEHNRLYALLFPEIAEKLYSDHGTLAHMSKLRCERNERLVATERRRVRRDARVDLAKKLRSKKQQDALAVSIAKEIAAMSGKLHWIRSLGESRAPALLYAQFNSRARLVKIDSMAVFKMAVQCRDSGMTVDAALKVMPFRDPLDVAGSIQLLKVAKVCVMRE